MAGITSYVKKALHQAGLRDTPLEVLPYPSKNYQTKYQEKLVDFLRRVGS